MHKDTLKALKGSIKKWEGIVAGTESDDGCDNCPLCERFYMPHMSLGCEREDGELCPVAAAAGVGLCQQTPYPDWAAAHGFSDVWPKKARDDETVMCAVLELEFLKSLLPSRQK